MGRETPPQFASASLHNQDIGSIARRYWLNSPSAFDHPRLMLTASEDLVEPKENPMRKYLLATMLICAFAAPALAKTYFIVQDKATGKCSMALSAPTETEKFSMMGQYGSELAAKEAMAKMKQCK